MYIKNKLNDYLILEKIKLKINLSNENYSWKILNYYIFSDYEKIGFINTSIEKDVLKIESIFIKSDYRDKKLGKEAVLEVIKKIKSKYNVNLLEYYAVSQQSGYFILSILKNPITIDTVYNEYESFETAVDKFGLQKYANADENGIYDGEDGSIRLVFKI